MGIGKDIAGWMRGLPKLTVLLDTDSKSAPRIHPRRLPQDAGSLPRAVVFHKISDVSEPSLGGVVQMSTARLQFDCFGRTPEEADGIRDRLKKELDAFHRGNMGTLRVYGVQHEGDRDDEDEAVDGSELTRFIAQCDYLLTYQRPTE